MMDDNGQSVIENNPLPVSITGAPSALPRELSVAEIKARLDKIQELLRTPGLMKQGVDYGKVPGTDKPTLLKPGSEKLCVLFQLGARKPMLDLRHEGDHLTVFAGVTLFHIPTGNDVYCGMAVCSTRESKYAWRRASRACPECGVDGSIIKGRAEWGGGWVCWKIKGGCGYKFVDTDPRITKQEVDRVPNADLPDTWNTVVKMAVKRAKIDATLGATGASAIFTQDIGDEEVSAEADDLGFEAAQAEEKKKTEEEAKRPKRPRGTANLPPAPTVTEEQLAWLRQQCRETEVQEQVLCSTYHHDKLDQFTEQDFEAASQIFKARREKMGLRS